VNQGRDGVSPVVASIYCSPQPAALQIDPPPGSGNFASMILRLENFFAMPVIYVYDTVESAWQKQTTRIKPTAPRSTLKPSSGRLPTKCAGNYAWIQHFIHHLSPVGVAGFVMAIRQRCVYSTP